MARQGNVDTSLYIDNFDGGINNLQSNRSLNNNELVDALNFDITRNGTLKLREGFVNIRQGTDCHSLFSDNKYIYFIDDDSLFTYDANGVEEVIDIGYKGLKTSYIKYQNSLIISNDKFIKRYKNGNVYDIAPIIFQNSFNVNTFENGGFPKGMYLISCCFVFNDGIEGGTMAPLQVELKEDNLGITISNFQLNYDPLITKLRVYISFTNATTQKFYADYDINTQSIDLRYNPMLGKDLNTFNKDPMPPGSLMDMYKGCIFTAKDNIIHISDPLSFLYDSNYYEFDSNITMICAVQSGLFVSDEYNVYFLEGNDPHNLNITSIYNSPAIKYSHSKNIMTKEIFFFTQLGQIVGQQDGSIQNITEKKFLPQQELLDGASFVRYKDGLRQIINSFRAGNNVNAGIGASIEATITRNKKI